MKELEIIDWNIKTSGVVDVHCTRYPTDEEQVSLSESFAPGTEFNWIVDTEEEKQLSACCLRNQNAGRKWCSTCGTLFD